MSTLEEVGKTYVLMLHRSASSSSFDDAVIGENEEDAELYGTIVEEAVQCCIKQCGGR